MSTLCPPARENTVIIGGRRAGLVEQIAAEHPGPDTVLGPIRLSGR